MLKKKLKHNFVVDQPASTKNGTRNHKVSEGRGKIGSNKTIPAMHYHTSSAVDRRPVTAKGQLMDEKKEIAVHRQYDYSRKIYDRLVKK